MRWLMNNKKAIVILTLLAMAGCKDRSPVLEPVVRENPDPKEIYIVDLKISNNYPRPFVVTGNVNYAVKNIRDCAPLDYSRAIGGVYPSIMVNNKIQVDMISDSIYRMKLFSDKYIDEDYYGISKCSWAISGVKFSINGVMSHDIFMSNKKIISGQAVEYACIHQAVVGKGGCPLPEYVDKKLKSYPMYVIPHKE